MTEVYKFGGASVKDASGVINLASIVAKRKNSLLVVISAMGKTTNALEALTRAYFSGGDTESLLQQVKDYHYQLMLDLFKTEDHPVFDEVNNLFVEVEWILEDEPFDFDYTYDQIVSIGELLSTKIVSHYLNFTGIQNLWADARNYILTDNTYREAGVLWDKSTHQIESHLLPQLQKQIVITQGFIGNTSENFTTTLGREGSDYSAAIFAFCLKAGALTIWKDVPGVLNADPKWFDKTELLKQLSYYDAIELAYYGATIIHPKTIKPLQNAGIPLRVKSFLDPQSEGTIISNEDTSVKVPSFIFKVNQVLLSVMPKDFSFIIEENLSQIFEALHQHRIKVNTMLNSALSFSISFDYDADKLDQLLAALSETYKVKYNTGMELVTIRYYNQDTLDRVIENKKVLLEVKSRNTCQMVMKNKTA